MATFRVTQFHRSACAEDWYQPKAKILTIFRKSGTLVTRLGLLAALEEEVLGMVYIYSDSLHSAGVLLHGA